MSTEKMSRRSIIKGVVAGAGIVAAPGALTGLSAAQAKKGKVMKYENSDFYKDDKFQVEKAKQAYYDMMKRFNYPIPAALKGDDFWAVDFSLGDFVNAGMAGIIWFNSLEDSYFAHEIFLLPGQMIVEHAHVKTAKAGPKKESWHVRHGSIYTMGEGKPTNPMPIKLPKSQAEKYITVKHCEKLEIGQVASLNRATAKHFMIAGPEGAIVSEYATYHDGDGLRFTNPGVAF